MDTFRSKLISTLGTLPKLVIKLMQVKALTGKALIRFQYYTVFILLGIPTMLGYGATNLLQGNTRLFIIINCHIYNLVV